MIRFSSFIRQTRMQDFKSYDAVGNGSGPRYGNKNFVKVLTGDFDFYVSDITKVKAFKKIEVSAGERPYSTELGRQPETIQIQGVPVAPGTKAHSLDAPFKLMSLFYELRKGIDPTISGNIIGSVGNLFIPGMIFSVERSTDYLNFPTHSYWLLDDIQTQRSADQNRTYIDYAFTLVEWKITDKDLDMPCMNCPTTGDDE